MRFSLCSYLLPVYLNACADGVQLLKRMNLSGPIRAKGFHQRLSASHGRHARNAVLQRGVTNRLLIKMRDTAEWCVDDKRNRAALDVVDYVRSALVHLENAFDFEANLFQPRRSSQSRHDLESQTRKPARQQHCLP